MATQAPGTGSGGKDSFLGAPSASKFAQLGIVNPTASSYNGAELLLTSMSNTSGLTKYLWNLPPHIDSLPVEPAVDPLTVDRTKMSINQSNGKAVARDSNGIAPLRRGRIYWYSRVDSEYTSDKANMGGMDPRYGFQFLWNPNQVTTSVAVNLDITPTAKDKFVKVVGAFPSGEYLTIACRIDRTNDFFSIKSLNSKGDGGWEDSREVKQIAGDMVKYYLGGSLEENFQTNAQNKIIELQKYGTLADIEYLYKAINGPGWKNAASGRDSSDTGFLSPTLLKIELGPFQYIGYIQNLTINHTDFTRSMIPIRSDVNLQFNLMATAGLSTSPTGIN